MELYSIESERVVLKELIQNPDFTKSVFLNNTLKTDVFTDLFHRDSFDTIKDHFNKFYCSPPNQELMRTHILGFITRSKDRYKDPATQRKLWIAGVKRLYVPQSLSESSSVQSHLNAILNFHKTRVIQKFLVDAEDDFSSGNIGVITDRMKSVVMETMGSSNNILEGDIVGDLGQHLQLFRMQRDGYYSPIPCGVRGVRDKGDSGDYFIVRLDDILDGGAFPGELTIWIGENNVGKSFALQETALYGASKGFNAMIVTIEMNKWKLQRRIYSRISGIPYTKFKKGTLTKDDWILLKKKLKEWKKNNGVVYVASFDMGCTVPDIAAKMQEVQIRKGITFDILCVDYLNDMTPVGDHKDIKSWSAMGEISWALASLAKWWNNHKGIAVVTANQKKSGSAGKGSTDWNDAAYGTVVTQHATVGLGLNQEPVDKEIGRIKVDVWKQRDGEKGMSFYVFPDFSISKLSSTRKMKEYYENMSDGEDTDGDTE